MITEILLILLMLATIVALLFLVFRRNDPQDKVANTSQKLFYSVLIGGVFVGVYMSVQGILMLQDEGGDLNDYQAITLGFSRYYGLLNGFIMFFFLVLISIGNYCLFKHMEGTKRIFFGAIVYYWVFTLFTSVVLQDSLFKYKKIHGLWEGGFDLSAFWGLLLCSGVTIMVVLNYFLMVLVRNYMEQERAIR